MWYSEIETPRVEHAARRDGMTNVVKTDQLSSFRRLHIGHDEGLAGKGSPCRCHVRRNSRGKFSEAANPMPALLLPCPHAKLVRDPATPQPARSQRDPQQRAWLPAPQCAAESVARARRSGAGQMPLRAAATPAAERSRHGREADSAATDEMANAAAFRSDGAAPAALDEHPARHAAGNEGGGAPMPSAAAVSGDEDGASWRVRGRASSYSAPETQQSPALPPPPKLLVFSGGTAFNSVAGEDHCCQQSQQTDEASRLDHHNGSNLSALQSRPASLEILLPCIERCCCCC